MLRRLLGRLELVGRQHVRPQLIQFDVEAAGRDDDRPIITALGFHVFDQNTVVRNAAAVPFGAVPGLP